jgi:NitT/TauT family transport system substrate-binding protein
VRLTLNGLAGGQQAGYINARALGYYADAGLDVTIVEGQGSGATALQVAAGSTDFGYVDALTLLRARANDESVVAVASVLQTDRYAVLSRQTDGVSRPADLHGRRVGVVAGSTGAALLSALLDVADIADATPVDLAPDDLVAALTEGRVSAIVGTVDYEALQLARLGIATTAMSVATAGVPMAGLSLIVSSDTLAREPALVTAFTRASLRGWDAARAQPDLAARAVVSQFLAGYEDEVAAELAADLPLLCGPDNQLVGQSSDVLWSETTRTGQRIGLLPPSATSNGAYARQILPADAPRCPDRTGARATNPA